SRRCSFWIVLGQSLPYIYRGALQAACGPGRSGRESVPIHDSSSRRDRDMGNISSNRVCANLQPEKQAALLRAVQYENSTRASEEFIAFTWLHRLTRPPLAFNR